MQTSLHEESVVPRLPLHRSKQRPHDDAKRHEHHDRHEPVARKPHDDRRGGERRDVEHLAKELTRDAQRKVHGHQRCGERHDVQQVAHEAPPCFQHKPHAHLPYPLNEPSQTYAKARFASANGM